MRLVSKTIRMTLALSLAFGPVAPAYADLIVDPSASQSFRPSLSTSSTNVPVVNIAPPTAGGVSHNKFSDYDIDAVGLIHNNSLVGGTATLGGTVTANPNLSGTTATTIVNEVTSSATSTLLGRAEVFGDKAGLIIANPNGITCNGCGALNASRFTLTTGVPTYDTGNGNSLYFDVTSGLITIDGNGLEGLDIPEAAVIARQIMLNGYISDALRVDLVSGGLRYDYSANLGQDAQSGITEQSLSTAGISYQIDASTLSSVSAGKINIIGTDNGVGVRIRGDITASTSDLTIDADGNLTITSNLTSEQDTILTTSETGSTLSSSGTIDAGRDLTITTTGAVTNTGTLQANRRVTIDTDDDLTNDSATITGSQIEISDATDISNASGTIRAGMNRLLFTSQGDEADLTALAVDLAAAINDNEGFQGFHAYVPAGGTPGVVYINRLPPYHLMEIQVATPTTGSDNQGFTYASTGSYSGTLTITGAIEANDEFQITAFGDVNIGSSSNKIATLSNDGGTIAGLDDISIAASGAITNNNGGSITADDDISITSDATITQNAQITAGGDLSLTGNDLSLGTTSGQYSRASGTVSLTETGSSSDFVYAGQDITGNTGLSITVDDQFTLSTALTAPGDITIDAARVTTDYNLVAGDDLSITTSGDVTNNAAIFAGDGTSGGEGLVIDAGGQIINSANGDIYGSGDVVLVSDARITNNAGGYIEAGDDLTLAVVSGGTISGGALSGGTKVTNGYILNTQAYVTAGGNLIANTSNFYNMRAVNVAGSGPYTITENDTSTTNYSNGWGSRIYQTRNGGSDYEYYRKLVSQEVLGTTSSSIYAVGNITLDATNILNRVSTIEAGGNVTINGSALTNQVAELLKVEHYREVYGSWGIGGSIIPNPSSPDYCTSGTNACFTDIVDNSGWIPETYSYSANSTATIKAAGTLTNNVAGGSVTNSGTLAGSTVLVTARNIQNGLNPGSTVTINQQITNSVSLTPTSLSNLSSLYTINAQGTSQYLISSSINLAGNTLTPDYLTSQLSAGAGATNGLQFLADPFVENRLLQQAALAATGSNFVLDDVENDQTAQRQALYDNAAAFANTNTNVQIGTALTETQIASLEVPVLWYVTEQVDGRDVLVPTLYLPTPADIEVAPSGQIIASNNILLEAEETVTNTGEITAGGTVLVQAQDVVNETLTTIGETEVAEGAIAFRTAAQTATISGENVFIVAESEDGERGTVTNTGGAILNTSADGQTIVRASGDIINQALVTDAVEQVDRGNFATEFRSDFSLRENYDSAVIGGQGNVSLVSTGGDILNDASEISSQGDVLIFAEGSFRQNNRTDTFVSQNSVSLGGSSSSSTSSSAGTSGSGYDDFEANAQASASGSQEFFSAATAESVYNQSASVSGQNVTIVANTGDIESIGSSISSAGNTILRATEGDVTLRTDSVVTNSSSLSISLGGNASAEAGGSGIDYNATAQASGSVGLEYGQQQNATFFTSTVSGNNVIIDAGNDINSIGAQVSATENLSLIAGNDINSIAQQELLENFSFSASNTTTAYATAGTTAGQFGTPDAAVGVENTTSIGFGGGTSTSSATSGFSAGGQLSLQAGNDINLVGTDLASGGDTILQAANDISISALQETSSSFGVGVSSTVGVRAGSGGVTPTASNSLGVSTSNATTFQEANVTTGGNFVAVAGGSTTLAGVNVNAGGDALLQGTTVTVTSVQDQISGTNFGFSSSPLTNGTGSNSSFTAESDAPLSASFSQTESTITTDRVDLNTGGNLNIVTTEGSATLAAVNANVAGNLNTAIADGSDLNITELQDTTSSTGFSVDVSIDANAAEAIAGTVEGVVEAIETGDAAAIVSSIPGANQIASTIAAIESGDGAAIIGALGGPGAGALAQQINGATGGALNGEGTGTNFGQSFLDASANTEPAVDVAELQGAVEDAGTIDVRLGAQFTETNSTTSVGSTINVGGSANISANDLNLTGSSLAVTGDTNLDLTGDLNVLAGTNTFDTFSAGGGVTVGFDAINQDVRVGLDGNFSESDSTSFTNSQFTTGGTLTTNVQGDANIIGGLVQANDINGTIQGDVNVVTLQNSTNSQSFEADLMVEVGVTGDSGGGELNFQGNINSEQSDAQQSGFVALNNNNVNIDGDLNLNSALFGAGNDLNANIGGDINATANVNTTVDQSFGGSLSVSANQAGDDSGAGGGGSLDVNVQLADANTVGTQSLIFGGNNNNLQVDGDANLTDSQIVGTNGNVNIGGELNVQTTQNTTSNFGLELGIEASGSSTNSAGEGEDSGSGAFNFQFGQGDTATTGTQAGLAFTNNLNLTTGGDTNLTNAQIIAGGDANLNIGGELNVTAVQDTENQIDVGVELGGGGEDGSVNQGNFGANFNLVDSNLNTAQSGINVGGGLTLTTGGDANLTGGVIQGGSVDANIGGDLNVTTIQEDEFALALNLEAGGGSEGAGGGSFGAGIDLTDRTETTTVAGITATNGNANVTVAGDTTLTGASITAQGGVANLDTQSLTTSNLSSNSLSLQAGIGGGFDGSNIDGEDTEAGGILETASAAGENTPSLNFGLEVGSGTTTGGVGEGATPAGTGDGSPTAAEAANTVLSNLQQQLASASQNQVGQTGGVSAEVLDQRLDTLRASASTTTIEAQAAANAIFNDGNPAEAAALEGLSPAQAVLMLQAARVWLTPDQQAELDAAIQTIVTADAPVIETNDEDDS